MKPLLSRIVPVIPVLASCALLTACFARPSLGQSSYVAVDLGPVNGSGVANAIDQGQAAGAVYTVPGDFSTYHATLFSNGAGVGVDLHPGFLDYAPLNAPGRSTVTGIWGATQVGYGSGVPTGQNPRALKWTGNADSAIILQPPFDTFETGALGIGSGDGQVAGYGVTVIFVNGRGTVRRFAGPVHALLWLPGASVAIDLHNGAESTVATAAGGGEQVGYGGKSGSGGRLLSESKAMLWHGNPSSFVWLHPQKGFATSQALATDGTQEVGSGLAIPPTRLDAALSHALLWSHTAASVVDLHPAAGFSQSFATGVSEGRQVGWGYVLGSGSTTHALVWSGSADSALDLNQFLPATFTSSQATAVDTGGNITGIAFDGATRHAIKWIPVVP